MDNFAIYATMKAKAGKEKAVEELLSGLVALAAAETGTKRWYALRGHDRTYSIFDTFLDEHSREDHLQGEIAAALMRHAPELFESGLQIAAFEVLAEKEN